MVWLLKDFSFQLPRPVTDWSAFDPHTFESFLKEQPGSRWPGRLPDWSAFEEKHPHTFDAMYRLWCEKQE